MTNTVQVIGNHIIVTKAFLKKAQVFGTDEYYALRTVKAENPNAAVRTKAIKKNPDKETFKKVTYENMEYYISLQPNKATHMAHYKIVRERSKIQKSPYKYVAKWFVDTFPDFRKAPVFATSAETAVEYTTSTERTAYEA